MCKVRRVSEFLLVFVLTCGSLYVVVWLGTYDYVTIYSYAVRNANCPSLFVFPFLIRFMTQASLYVPVNSSQVQVYLGMLYELVRT